MRVRHSLVRQQVFFFSQESYENYVSRSDASALAHGGAHSVISLEFLAVLAGYVMCVCALFNGPKNTQERGRLCPSLQRHALDDENNGADKLNTGE